MTPEQTHIVVVNAIIIVASVLVAIFGRKIADIGKTKKAKKPDGKAPECLSTINGCGKVMVGSFYREPDPGLDEAVKAGNKVLDLYRPVNVGYYCFCLFWIPIVPLGCYAYEMVNAKQYRFYGSQNWNFWEVLSLFVSRWPAIPMFIGVINILQLLF